jgi:AraC-like DNA-binding protein
VANRLSTQYHVVNTYRGKDAHSRIVHIGQSAPTTSNKEIVPAARTDPRSTAQVPGPTSDWERLAREAEYSSAKMASLQGVSARHSQRLFKKHLGCSPTQWLRMLQCRLAKDLLSQGYSSKAAAAALKFSTDAHFCREFKKVCGASPQKFAPHRVNRLNLSGLAENSSSTKPAGHL